MTLLLKNVTRILCSTLIVSSLMGCNLLDLTTPSQVVRPRVAGIRAMPAEINIGESTQLDALFVQPAGDESEWGALWFSCVEAGGARGCLGSGGLLEGFGGTGGGPTGDDDDSAGAPGGDLPDDPRDVQFSAEASFTYTAHGTVIEEAWTALTPEERVEGLVVLVSVNYVPRSQERLQELLLTVIFSEQNGDPAAGKAAAAELAELVSNGINAARRIVISDKTADQPAAIDCPVQELLPNQNPDVEGLLLHVAEDGKDQGLSLGQVTFVAPEDVLVLRPVLSEGSIEDYLYITTDGETLCRQESPYFAWITNAGRMGRDYSFLADEGDLDEVAGRLKINHLTLPEAAELPPHSDLWLVVRDRRGGIDWRRFDLLREE